MLPLPLPYFFQGQNPCNFHRRAPTQSPADRPTAPCLVRALPFRPSLPRARSLRPVARRPARKQILLRVRMRKPRAQRPPIARGVPRQNSALLGLSGGAPADWKAIPPARLPRPPSLTSLVPLLCRRGLVSGDDGHHRCGASGLPRCSRTHPSLPPCPVPSRRWRLLGAAEREKSDLPFSPPFGKDAEAARRPVRTVCVSDPLSVRPPLHSTCASAPCLWVP
jgi:hypothetical protein